MLARGKRTKVVFSPKGEYAGHRRRKENHNTNNRPSDTKSERPLSYFLSTLHMNVFHIHYLNESIRQT